MSQQQPEPKATMIEEVEFAGQELTKEETRHYWETATSLAERCELTALGMEGKTSGWQYTKIEQETDPILDELVTLNRLRYLTFCSQPGGGGHRALVYGFAEKHTTRYLLTLNRDTELIVQARPADEYVEEDDAGTASLLSCRNYVEDALERGDDREAEIWRGVWEVGIMDPELGREDYLWEKTGWTLTRAILDKLTETGD